MPLTRYQIRSEYSLADPELYRAADTDHPEALLEGVAMAGLVGVLRQLGDLSEFAAEIFHGLHEEVMATAARDHRLMIRVQQLEVEIPSIEKGFLSQTSHSLFLYNAGTDWHPNLRMDQNLITQENLPRFVMDSYEECRGPPRLFLLDKFDIGGAGACLKRYSDPSFFKPELTSPETMKTDVQREKKARKIKRKGTRWRNRETPEMMPTSHAKLHQLFLEKDSEIENNVPINRVKLKKRLLDESSFDSTIGKSYMVRFLEILSPEHKVVCGSSINPARLKRKSNNNIESGNAIQEISTWSPPKKLLQRQRIPDSSCSNQETVLEPVMNELGQDAIVILEKLLEPMADVGVGKIPSNLCKVEGQKKPVIDGERKTEASVDGYRSDGIASEMNNCTDSLATVESEMENEHITNIERQGMDSGPSEEQKELQARFSVSNSFGNSSTSGDGNNLFKKGSCSFSYSDTLSNLADNSLSDGDVAVKVYPSTKYFPVDAVDISAKNLSTNKDILETKSSEFVVLNSGRNEVSEIPNNGSEFRETSSNSCVTDVTSTLSHLNPGRRLSEVQSAEPEMTEISSVCMKAGTVESSSNIEYGKYLGGDLACMTNGSDFPSKMRDDSLSTGSARSLPLEELEGRIIKSVNLLHLSNISNLSLENKEDDNALAEVLPTEYTKESSSTENLIKGKLDSPHSVTLPTEDQSYGLAEQDQETCSSTTSLSEFLSVSITPGDLDAIESDGIVVELDNVIPSIGDNSEYLTSVLDILESGNFAGQDSPEITDKVLPLELDSVKSGVKRSSNSPDVMHISTTEAKDGLDSNEVSSLDSMGKGTASLGFSSGCIVSDSPKPISETEVHLHAENFVTGIVHTEAIYDGTIVGPNLIGSPSRNCINLQEECLSIHGESDQHELEFSEASSPNNLLESDDPKEANGLADSSTCLRFDSFNPNYHDPTCSELLDLHDLLLVGHTQNHLPLSDVTGATTSSKESNQELEPKCSHQNLAENLEDDESSPVHAIPELRVPLEKASKLQVDQPNVESLHEGSVTPESSDLHSEQTQSPKYLDQDGCFNTPSESFAVDPLSHLSEPEFAPLPTSHDFASLGTALDPSDSVFPSSGQQLLELHLSRSVLKFPSATPNVVQANMEEMPLLPPLPPMQWRIGKLQDGSPASEGEMVQPRLNTFTPLLVETADEKAQWSFRTLDQPLNPFLPLSAIEDDKPQRGSETLFGEMVWSSLSPFSSALSATVSDENSQRGFPSLEVAIMQSVIPFLPSPAIDPVKSKHASPTLEEEMVQPTFNLFSPFPTIEDVKPRHFSPSLQGELEQPVNLLALKPNTEHKKAQQNSSTLEGDMMQPLNSSAPPLTMEDEKAQHGSPNFMGETAWPVEDGKPNVSFRMRHRRPRSPLIEAVASHDKSMLRKVMEFTRPINGPKEDERDSLLEQIRAKSFNLRPAVKTKPSIQGPKTNLKIAAILEKANAIRQAFAGSDEDDDGDSWSDS